MSRLLLVALFLEVGFVLIVVPWSSFWDHNYFAESLPVIDAIISNNYVRGAVSGLGIDQHRGRCRRVVFAALLAKRGTPAGVVDFSVTRDRRLTCGPSCAWSPIAAGWAPAMKRN